MNITQKFIFVIDTDQYAGNFERELCAYITGTTGECGVGDDCAEAFIEELGEDLQQEFYNIIEMCADDHGTRRPCSIVPSKGTRHDKYPIYNSVGIYFESLPSDDMIKIMKERAIKFNDISFNITGFRLITETTTITEVNC